VPTAVYVAAAGEETTPTEGEGEGGDETTPSGNGDEPSTGTAGESEPSDSLANLNEQAPWAFAIVALLVGAFLATGKTFNVLGAKREEGK
jgi:hypothetical protein